MESKISLTVPGEPQGKLRPRWSPVGTYTPKKTVDYETYIKETFAISYPDFRPLEGALMMKLEIWLMIPKSASKKRKKLMEERIIRPTKKPDFDNTIKTVCDALEGLAYKNDNQIVTSITHKFYSVRPRLEIEIYGVQV